MKVSVLLFAAAREAVGQESISVEVPDGANVAQVLEQLGQQIPTIAHLVSSSRLAVDNEYAPASQVITNENEIAFIPPVSGG